MMRERVVEIGPLATSFTAVCVECRDLNAAEGYSSSTFAGRLDLDLDRGTFLCRRGHAVQVIRAQPTAAAGDAAA